MAVDASHEPVSVHLLPEFSCSLEGAVQPLSGVGRSLAVRLALEGGSLHRKVI